MSLSARISLSAGVVLLVFIILSVVALDRAFRDSARFAMQERLLGQIYLLMAAAEVDAQGRLSMPPALPEARLALPDSGLYAQIVDGTGKLVWRSHSTLGTHAPVPTALPAGEQEFTQQDGRKHGYLLGRYGIDWASAGNHYPFTFSVAEELSPLYAQIGQYRRTLWLWLGTMALLLLFAQALVLRWGLRPLRRVAEELAAIEAGQQEQLQQPYPSELSGLTQGLNDLLRHERALQKRHRDALSDLAHSLKTPLAVLQGALAEGKAAQLPADVVAEQVTRMDHIVRYQLQRAATAGHMSLAAPVGLHAVVSKLVDSLAKVHRQKSVQMQIDVADTLCFRGDEGDLMELLGNTLDNAYKWCRHRVRISAVADGEHLNVRIEDDGPGISAGDADRLLQRGARADERVPGHGIGLAVVRDIIQLYDGELAIERSELGGAQLRLVLPGA